MSKKISGAEYPLAKIFSSDFEYHIPLYQRPYAWTVDQVSDLFDDLYDFHQTENDEGYFLGSIVLIKQETKPYAEVIDGQQRLTTLTILLAALAHQLVDKKRRIIRQYITEPGNEYEKLAPKPRLTLRERDKEFFTKYVQSLDFDELLKLDQAILENESQENIQGNSKYFLNTIKNTFSDDTDKLDDFVGFLLNRCFLVAVSTPNQQSAFRVFSVLNSRGLDLQPTDIIKADVVGKITDSQKRYEYNERWEDMEIELGRGGFNDLFTFIRMIFAKQKAKKGLLEEFRAHVIDEIQSSEKLIEDILQPYATALAIIKQSNYQASSNAQETNDHLRWLNRIDNSDWIPVAIFFMSQQKHNPKYISWFFKKLERLAACLHVCRKNVNQRIERYREIINALEQEHSLENPVKAVDLSESEMSEMKGVLDGNVYELTPQRRNYIILRLDSFMSDGGASYDSTVLTLEHVLPQTVNPNSEWAKHWPDEEKRIQWVHKISNLIPLNKRRNSQAQNYDFEKKKSKYFKGNENVSSYILTSQVLAAKSWKEEDLKLRQKELLDAMSNNWELDKAADVTI